MTGSGARQKEVSDGSTRRRPSVEMVLTAGPTRKSLAASFLALAVYLPEQLADFWAVAALAIVGVVLLTLVGAMGQRG